MVTVKERVRFVETDMLGVVHHANYFQWFEMGRVEYLRQAGILLLDLIAEGIMFPISDVSCHYRAPARFDDWLAIETKLAEISKAKLLFHHQIIREGDGLLLATGSTQNVFTDLNGKVVRLPPDRYNQLYTSFLQENPGE